MVRPISNQLLSIYFTFNAGLVHCAKIMRRPYWNELPTNWLGDPLKDFLHYPAYLVGYFGPHRRKLHQMHVMTWLPFWAVYATEAGMPSHSNGWRVIDKRRKMTQTGCDQKGARLRSCKSSPSSLILSLRTATNNLVEPRQSREQLYNRHHVELGRARCNFCVCH